MTDRRLAGGFGCLSLSISNFLPFPSHNIAWASTCLCDAPYSFHHFRSGEIDAVADIVGVEVAHSTQLCSS
jgi:hypothetical protein